MSKYRSTQHDLSVWRRHWTCPWTCLQHEWSTHVASQVGLYVAVWPLVIYVHVSLSQWWLLMRPFLCLAFVSNHVNALEWELVILRIHIACSYVQTFESHLSYHCKSTISKHEPLSIVMTTSVKLMSAIAFGCGYLFASLGTDITSSAPRFMLGTLLSTMWWTLLGRLTHRFLTYVYFAFDGFAHDCVAPSFALVGWYLTCGLSGIQSHIFKVAQ